MYVGKHVYAYEIKILFSNKMYFVYLIIECISKFINYLFSKILV